MEICNMSMLITLRQTVMPLTPSGAAAKTGSKWSAQELALEAVMPNRH